MFLDDCFLVRLDGVFWANQDCHCSMITSEKRKESG